jgi:hypothetical protein
MSPTSAGTTITVPTAVTLKAGTILKVYSGTGTLAGSTKVAADVTRQTQFQVTAAPTTSDHGFGQKIDLVTVHLATIGGDHKCSQFNFGITML